MENSNIVDQPLVKIKILFSIKRKWQQMRKTTHFRTHHVYLDFSRPDAGIHILEPRILQGHYDTSFSPIVCGLVRMRSNFSFVVDVKSYKTN